jgi:hypothetical protein
VSKHGAYLFDLIKEAQELVLAKLVTINGFLRTMIKTDTVKIFTCGLYAPVQKWGHDLD